MRTFRVLWIFRDTAVGWCYALIGHPELSTTTALFMSHHHPDDKHLRVNAVPW
jgi:hypothetical protein